MSYPGLSTEKIIQRKGILVDKLLRLIYPDGAEISRYGLANVRQGLKAGNGCSVGIFHASAPSSSSSAKFSAAKAMSGSWPKAI